MLFNGFSKKILFAVICVFFISTASYGGEIKLDENVKTGMKLEEVKKHLNIHHYFSNELITAYRIEGKWIGYAFNKSSGKLMYKSIRKHASEKEELMDKFKSQFDTVIRSENNILYFSNKGEEFGIKIIDKDTDNDTIEVWKGSISLWNDIAEKSNMKPFLR